MSDKCGIVIDFFKVLQSELKKSMNPDCFETAMECAERAFKEFCFNTTDLNNG